MLRINTPVSSPLISIRVAEIWHRGSSPGNDTVQWRESQWVQEKQEQMKTRQPNLLESVASWAVPLPFVLFFFSLSNSGFPNWISDIFKYRPRLIFRINWNGTSIKPLPFVKAWAWACLCAWAEPVIHLSLNLTASRHKLQIIEPKPLCLNL